MSERDTIDQMSAEVRRRLLAERTSAGHWLGELSSSALSTAVATAALEMLRQTSAKQNAGDAKRLATLVHGGFHWLAQHQNADGGWGDTIDSPSNLSTTTLCWAAFGLSADSVAADQQAAVARAEAWLRRQLGGLSPERLAAEIRTAYGKDRTFSVPILTMCALTGRLGAGREAWREIPALPFELAALPHTWFRRLGLPVVSYALPALIAIGQARHHYRPTRNPFARLTRSRLRERTLRVLETLQPASGGFLEAAPLTGFVLMSLVGIGRAEHPVARRAADFLIESVRTNGSWPIDTNLATWVTTLSIGALCAGGRLREYLSAAERAALRDWLLKQQHRVEHPYTHAAPGGWAWTDLSGGVPDGDDTPGTLLALRYLAEGESNAELLGKEPAQMRGVSMSASTCEGSHVHLPKASDTFMTAVEDGIRWLLDLRNRDGGVPTFCRGWGKLPFDHSSPDLTAHALRAWHAWRGEVSAELRARIDHGIAKAVDFLLRVQREDGAWIPLWFGNQSEPRLENPLYGTARVALAAGVEIRSERLREAWHAALRRAGRWLLDSQNTDGGWGGTANAPSSIEETALALEALAHLNQSAHDGANAAQATMLIDKSVCKGAIARGVDCLSALTTHATLFPPSPIGLYFAKLWYHERLYPLIFATAALERVRDR